MTLHIFREFYMFPLEPYFTDFNNCLLFFSQEHLELWKKNMIKLATTACYFIYWQVLVQVQSAKSLVAGNTEFH